MKGKKMYFDLVEEKIPIILCSIGGKNNNDNDDDNNNNNNDNNNNNNNNNNITVIITVNSVALTWKLTICKKIKK